MQSGDMTFMPQTRKTLVEKYTTKLREAVASLPGGNLSQKELDKIADEYAYILGDKNLVTLDDIEQAFQNCIKSVRTRAENADIKYERWGKIDDTISELKGEFKKDYDKIYDILQLASLAEREDYERIVLEAANESRRTPSTDNPHTVPYTYTEESISPFSEGDISQPKAIHDEATPSTNDGTSPTEVLQDDGLPKSISEEIAKATQSIVTKKDFFRVVAEMNQLAKTMNRDESAKKSKDVGPEIGE